MLEMIVEWSKLIHMDELVRKYVIDRFSADSFCDEIERMKLEQKYQSRLEILDDINRKSVSFQLSKNDRFIVG